MEKKKIKRPVIYYEEYRPEGIEKLTPREVLKRPYSRTVKSVSGDNKEFLVFIDTYALSCIAGRIFWKKTSKCSITYKNSRIYGAITCEIISTLIVAFKLDWIDREKWVKKLVGQNKTLWKLILSGKITNPEDLAKKYSKLYFKGSYSYKTLKEYFKCEMIRVSLWDAYYHTTNPDLCIRKLTKSYSENNRLIIQEETNLLEDSIHYCRYDNTKVNPLWSVKRLRSEHQKQIEKDLLEDSQKLSDELIAEEFKKDRIELILSEKRCFFEASMMHNCIHSCYWPKVIAGDYILAKGTIDDIHFDLGLQVVKDEIVFNQVHSIYNGNVPEYIEEFCKKWMFNNRNDLLQISKNIKSKKLISNTCLLPIELGWF